jgi:hypothetical protein
VAIPSITQTIRDPGLPTAPAAITNFLYMGVAEKGSTTAINAFSSPGDVVDAYGQGPLSEDICYHLAIAGGPVYGLRMTGTAPPAPISTVTKTAVSSSTGTITVAGTPLDSYDVRVEIRVTGALGAAQFRYSLDGGLEYSEQIIAPSGGTYALANTGLTLTFVPGAGPIVFEKGDVHTFATVEQTFTTTTLATAMDVVLADNTGLAAIVLSGRIETASAAATIAAAAATHASALFQRYRPIRFMMDAGGDIIATTKTAFASFTSTRVLRGYGRSILTSGKPIVGRGSPKASVVRAIAARAADSLISTDLAWYSAGPLPGVQAITHNEYLQELMDGEGYATLRTHQGEPGFYITNARLSSPAGSDYQFWQHGRLMDVATATTYRALLPFLSSIIGTLADGTIDPLYAVIIEDKARDALRTVLQDPDNAQGLQGHVSALDVKVDRKTNVLASNTIKVKVAIRPHAYAKFIVNELSFAANVGG